MSVIKLHILTSAILFLSGLTFSTTPASEVFIPDENNSWAFPTECIDPWAASPMDLRFLNEEIAGANGPVKLSADGKDFIRGDGQTMKAWMSHLPGGVNKSGTEDAWTLDDYRRSARFFARYGLNVGIIGSSNPSDSKNPTHVSATTLEGYHRHIAAAKAAGIYLQLRICWFHGIKGKELGLNFHQERDLQCTLQFHPEVQAIWKSWVKDILSTVNPHTGIALKDEHALFSIEIANEDSLLFYTTDKIEGGAREELEHQFYTWCMKKYGSADKALAAWNDFKDKGDAIDQERLGVIIVWFMTRAGAGKANEQRCQDTLQFLIDTMQAWQKEAKDFIQQEMGAKHILVAGSNFNPADRVTMDDALRLLAWKDVDIIENNHYFNDNGKGGPNTGYRVDVDYIQGLHSGVKDPLGLPTNKRQVANKPFLCTEILWPRPHPYGVEGPLLVSAYQAMNGIDGLAWAGPRSNTWDNVDSAYYPFWNIRGNIPLRRWNCAGPDGVGQFPAAAAILRLGLLKEATPIITEKRTHSDIIQRKEPVIAEQFAYDPTQYGKLLETANFDTGTAYKEAFLIGPVTTALSEDVSSASIGDVSSFIKGNEIHSSTGELISNPAKGLTTINAPAVVGAIGFLRDNSPITLGAISITSNQEHGTICVVALDAKPLADSTHILIQIGTRSVPTGWKESKATITDKDQTLPGPKIDATGNLPWRVRKCKASITFASLSASTMIFLDGNGNPKESKAIIKGTGPITINLPEDAPYVILQ